MCARIQRVDPLTRFPQPHLVCHAVCEWICCSEATGTPVTLLPFSA